MRTHPRGALGLLVACLAACGGRSELAAGGACGADALDCVRAADDPCGPPEIVASVCDAQAHVLRCPAGAWPYARAAEGPTPCLPFSDPSGPIRSLGGSLLRLPTDDGRCLWLADIETTAGEQISNVALEPDRTAPFGTCPVTASFAGGTPGSIVTVEGESDPSLVVQLDTPFRFAGRTQVVYRFFKSDPAAVFGFTLLGGGLGRWDPGTQRIVIPDPHLTLPFSTDLQLGDAALVTPDFAFVWGCPRSEMGALVQGCVVTRQDPLGNLQLFAGGGSWVESLDGTVGATVFTSGSWTSAVAPGAGAGSLFHVFVGDFGSTLESQVAAAPEGPWTDGPTLGACDLPASDAHAFCNAPVVHQELADPTRPGEVVVSYDVSTLATNAGSLASARPEDYWPRLVWAPAPP